MDTITDALSARDTLYDLGHRLNRLPYNSDLNRLHNNISKMVDDLSRAEVYARRTPPRSSYHMTAKKLKADLTKAITHLEHLILIAQLMA